MEIIVIVVGLVIVGLLIYGIINSSSSALETLDINKDGKVDVKDAQEAVKQTAEAVKKVAQKATPSKRGRKPSATKTAAKKKG